MLGPFIVRLDRFGDEVIPGTDAPQPGERDVVLDGFDRYRQGMLLYENDIDEGTDRPRGTWYYRRDNIWNGRLQPTARTPNRGEIWYQGDRREISGPDMEKYAEYLLQTYPTFRPQPGSLEAKVAAEMDETKIGPYSWDYALGAQHLGNAIAYHDLARFRRVLAEEPLDAETLDKAITALAEGSDWDIRYSFPEADLVALVSRVPDRGTLSRNEHLVHQNTAITMGYDRLVLALETVLGPHQYGEPYAVELAIEQRDGLGYELARELIRRGGIMNPKWLPGALPDLDAARLVEEFGLTLSQDFAEQYGDNYERVLTGWAYRIFVAHGMTPDPLAEQLLEGKQDESLAIIQQLSQEDLARALAFTMDLSDSTLTKAILARLDPHYLNEKLVEEALQVGNTAFLAALPAGAFQYIARIPGQLEHLPRKAMEYLVRNKLDAGESAVLNAVAQKGWFDLGQALLERNKYAQPDLDRALETAYAAYSSAGGSLGATYAAGQLTWARRFGGPQLLARQAEADTLPPFWKQTLPALPTRIIVALLADGLPARWLPTLLVHRMAEEPWPMASLDRGELFQLHGLNMDVFRSPLDRLDRALAAVLPPDLVRYLRRVF